MSKVEAGQAAAHLCSRVYGTRDKGFFILLSTVSQKLGSFSFLGL